MSVSNFQYHINQFESFQIPKCSNSRNRICTFKQRHRFFASRIETHTHTHLNTYANKNTTNYKYSCKTAKQRKPSKMAGG